MVARYVIYAARTGETLGGALDIQAFANRLSQAMKYAGICVKEFGPACWVHVYDTRSYRIVWDHQGAK